MIMLQTLGFIPSYITIPKLIPLFHTVADVPSRYPWKLPSLHCLNSSAPILQVCSDTPKLACRCDADAKVFTDVPKCYTVITLHHLSGSVTWGGWLGVPGPWCCSYPLWTSRTSQTLLCAANSCHCTHASFKNEYALVLQLPHTQSGWCSTVRAWTNPWLSSTEHQPVLQRCHTEQPAYDMCLSWSAV